MQGEVQGWLVGCVPHDIDTTVSNMNKPRESMSESRYNHKKGIIKAAATTGESCYCVEEMGTNPSNTGFMDKSIPALLVVTGCLRIRTHTNACNRSAKSRYTALH